jgi:hypothetical protein
MTHIAGLGTGVQKKTGQIGLQAVVCFLLGNSPVSEIYMLTYRNTPSVPSSKAGRCRVTKLRIVEIFIQDTVLKFSHSTPASL